MPQLVIVRQKAGATHFAAQIDRARGLVTRWSEDRESAQRIRDDDAEPVFNFYNGRPNAGSVHFLDAATGRPFREPARGTEPPPAPAPRDPAGPVGGAAKEYRKQAEALNERLEQMEREQTELVAGHKAEIDALTAANDKLRAQVVELEQLVASAK
jgi:hypothetical protein